jgi:hypothetical protein
MSQSVLYVYPSPIPLPSSITNYAVSETTAILPAAANAPETIDVDESFTSTLASSTLQIAAQVVAAQAGSLTQFQELSFTSTDDAGNRTIETYGAPQTLDEFPASTANLWSNGPQATINTSYADGETASEQIAADGSFVDTERIYGTAGTYPEVDVTVQQDGSGNAEVQETFRESSGGSSQIDYALSLTGASGPITIGVSSSQGAPAIVATIPVWFSTPLYQERYTDEGLQTMPQSCTAANDAGQANLIHYASTRVDAADGTLETVTEDRYEDSAGAVQCLALDDKVQEFYDFNNDGAHPGLPTFSSTPLATNETAETLNLATGSGTSASMRLRRMASENVGSFPAAIVAFEAGVRSRAAMRRLQFLHSLIKSRLGQ